MLNKNILKVSVSIALTMIVLFVFSTFMSNNAVDPKGQSYPWGSDNPQEGVKQKMILIKRVFIISAVMLMLSSCTSLRQPSNIVEYYTLEYPPLEMTGIKTLPYTIKIERFNVAPFYNSNQMIYRDRSHKRDAYAYHKWRVNPGDLVSYFLSRDIRYSGLFRAVLPDEGRMIPSFILTGMVDEFVEWDENGKWKAVLSLNMIFRIEKVPDIEKRILYQKSYNTYEVCTNRSPEALAKAMSRAMAKVSYQIQKDIFDFLNKHESW